MPEITVAQAIRDAVIVELVEGKFITHIECLHEANRGRLEEMSKLLLDRVNQISHFQDATLRAYKNFPHWAEEAAGKA